MGKAKGVKFDPVNLKLDFAARTFDILHEAPKVETPYQKVVGTFNGQPLRTKEIKEKLAKDLSGRTVDDALKAAVRNGDLNKIGNGLYQKSTENQPSQPPIGIAKAAKSGQAVDGVEDSRDLWDADEIRDDGTGFHCVIASKLNGSADTLSPLLQRQTVTSRAAVRVD